MTAQPAAAQPDLAGVSFAAALERHGDRPAVVVPGAAGSSTLTYRDLARRVDEVVRLLGPTRRLVALEPANDLPSLTAYLAALAAGHPLLVLPTGKPDAAEAIIAAYDPDVVMRSPGLGTPGLGTPVGGAESAPAIHERRRGTRHELHPDLALLISTSGSTGSPKLVRLSSEGVEANASAIAQYLHLRDADRAATTLPMSYCYGLSVINSHLEVGAAVVLTDLSVVDPCFWDLARTERVTSFAAVPYTFDLLDRVGFADMDLPHLRYITQAGGKLEPERVRRYAAQGRRRGWDLFVMYGATEATARMAYLPPDLAAEHPHAIGVPIPGGSFRLDPVDGLDGPDGEPVHELVYSGPNVMLGYAEEPADLSHGRTVAELRTGDLARRTGPGLYEIVGRRSRFVKIAGLRVDLGQVERMLAHDGVAAAAVGDDTRLVLAVETAHDGGPVAFPGPVADAKLVAKDLAARLGLPRAAVVVRPVESIPRLPNGKVDYGGVLALAATSGGPATARRDGLRPNPSAGPSTADIARIFAEALEIEHVGGEDTFVSLGGDSLSYVAASVRLESALGTLPLGWHLMPVAELAALAPDPDLSADGALHADIPASHPAPVPGGVRHPGAGRRRARPLLSRAVAPMETGIVLRALAIVFIIATHIEWFIWPGTAHVLFALAGFNFARFQLTGNRRERLRSQARSLARILVPSVAFIAFAYAVTGDYTVQNILLLNSLLGPEGWNTTSRFWFVEELVYVLLAVMALLAFPWAGRAQRRWPFGFPLALFGIALAERFHLIPPVAHQGPVLWLFALGWVTAAARTLWQRSLVTFLALVTVPGFFHNEYRNATILAGVLLLLWLPTLPVPRGLHRLVAVLASASLYVYLSHWLVYPLVVEAGGRLGLAGGEGSALAGAAVGVSLVAGTAYWAVASRAMAAVERVWRRSRAAGAFSRSRGVPAQGA
ncbi:AMP-binding protein [Sinomonas sp. B1-1]|uniref:AMP-binding protein n=1 Tax=Sinomonas sp. B1-1 TaxID=3141454 RepID=UPI003D271173